MTIGVSMRITAFCNKGDRRYMEDYYTVAYQQSTQEPGNLEFAFFGIYDGHGGESAAKYAKEHLMNNIILQKGFYSENDEEVKEAIKEGYLVTHKGMWKNLEKWPKTASGLPSTAGTTASVAFIRHGKIYIGHVGDSGIVLGIENENERTWKARQLTQDHKPESTVEKNRIMSSGGKVIVKSGVPRVVWNRPKIGHKGPIRRSTPIDEIPFLAVARSLGDLWSYNYALDEFVVSPEPDVHVIKIDPNTFKCLIFGTDGLWNVLDAQSAVELVRSTDLSNDAMVIGNAQEWRNPSRCLVENALNNWNRTRMRADNTSVVTVMLDPTNKKNLLKIGNTPVNMTSTKSTCQSESSVHHHQQQQPNQPQSDHEDRNVTMFDYSTRSAYNLDRFSVGCEASTSAILDNRVNPDYMFDGRNLYHHHPPSHSNVDYYADNSVFHSSLSHDPYHHNNPYGSPSSHLRKHHEDQPLNSTTAVANYSLTKLQSRNERENEHFYQMFSPKRFGYHYGPSTSSAPPHFMHPEMNMNVLPSIHNLVNDHSKYSSMERFDYVNYVNVNGQYNYRNEYFHNYEGEHAVNNNQVETSDLGSPSVEDKNSADDDSIQIQINEVSSSLTDTDTVAAGKCAENLGESSTISTINNDKENTEDTNNNNKTKSVKKRISIAKTRIFYETRLTKTKPRSCNSTYSQKNSVSIPNRKKISNKKKLATKNLTIEKPQAVVASITKKFEAALEATTTTINKLKKKNIVKNKENTDNANEQQQPVRSLRNSLRNSIRICNNIVAPSVDSHPDTGKKAIKIKSNSFIKQQEAANSLKRKTAFDTTNNTTRNSKLRKLK